MSVTTANLAMGPGTLYTGAFSAPEPLPQEVNNTPAASAWTDVGGTQGGLALSIANTWVEIEVDQLYETPERRLTKREVTLKTQLGEVTFANLVLALTGGTPTTGASWNQYEPDDPLAGSAPTYTALIFDGVAGNAKRRRVFMRKVLNTDNVDTSSDKGTQMTYTVMFTSHYVSSSIRSYRIVQST
jgi:hypothetical protein